MAEDDEEELEGGKNREERKGARERESKRERDRRRASGAEVTRKECMIRMIQGWTSVSGGEAKS